MIYTCCDEGGNHFISFPLLRYFLFFSVFLAIFFLFLHFCIFLFLFSFFQFVLIFMVVVVILSKITIKTMNDHSKDKLNPEVEFVGISEIWSPDQQTSCSSEESMTDFHFLLRIIGKHHSLSILSLIFISQFPDHFAKWMKCFLRVEISILPLLIPLLI